MLDAMHVHDGAPANGPRVSPRVVHREVPWGSRSRANRAGKHEREEKEGGKSGVEGT